MNYVTVIYRIEDDATFSKVNPLTLQHHGLKAVAVSVGDLLEWKEQATQLLKDRNLTPPPLDWNPCVTSPSP